MISPEIKAINMGAIEQLGLDLMQCESTNDSNIFVPIYFWFCIPIFTILLLKFILVFASIVQIEGLDNDTILLCFTDLRQVRASWETYLTFTHIITYNLIWFGELVFQKLIDLILSKEWSLYLKDYGQPDNKYNRVQASAALVLLEK